jgi:hypothetical protein
MSHDLSKFSFRSYFFKERKQNAAFSVWPLNNLSQ